jgi:hypothetical protein
VTEQKSLHQADRSGLADHAAAMQQGTAADERKTKRRHHAADEWCQHNEGFDNQDDRRCGSRRFKASQSAPTENLDSDLALNTLCT